MRGPSLDLVSILDGINSDFRVGIGTGGHSQIETIKSLSLPSKVSSSPRAHHGWDLGDHVVMIGIGLLIHPDCPRTSRNIDALAFGAVIQVVGVLNGWYGRDHFSITRVKHGKGRGFARAHDDPVI